MNHISRTPFGARPTLAQAAVRAAAELCPPEATTPKWDVLRHVSRARTRLGISDRAVTVLSALVSFHRGDDIAPGTMVFPSNRVLGERAHGMSAATLRRHIAQLVEAGLVIRRDSPNGKRYARRGEDGEIALAFGFELTPLAARAAEFERLAAEVERERRRLAEARERLTLLRRDVLSTLAMLAGEGVAVPAGPLPPPPRRTAGLAEIEDAAFATGLRLGELTKHLDSLLKTRNLSGNAFQSERHKQDSNPDVLDSEPLQEDERVEPAAPQWEKSKVPESAGRALQIDLPMVLAACPSLSDWSTNRIRSWPDLVRLAETIRPALGISPDAWHDAVDAMGDSGAAVTLATILQRHDRIGSHGGYLRSLSAKARHGRFSPSPVVVSLLRQRAKSEAARL